MDAYCSLTHLCAPLGLDYLHHKEENKDQAWIICLLFSRSYSKPPFFLSFIRVGKDWCHCNPYH